MDAPFLTWAAEHDVDAAALRDDVVGHRLDRFACTLVGEIAATNRAVLYDLPHTRPIGKFEENHRHLLARRKHRLWACDGILGRERGDEGVDALGMNCHEWFSFLGVCSATRRAAA